MSWLCSIRRLKSQAVIDSVVVGAVVVTVAERVPPSIERDLAEVVPGLQMADRPAVLDHVGRALDDLVEPHAHLALGRHGPALGEVHPLGDLGDVPELLVGEVPEERDVAELSRPSVSWIHRS